MAGETDQVNRAMDAIASVVPRPPFKEVWTFDKGRIDDLPGITMGYGGSKRADDKGIRTVKHLHTWRHDIIVRIWYRTDPADSSANDRGLRQATAALVDAIEADPTLGGKVQASGILDIGTVTQLMNRDKRIVAQGVDINVAVVLSGDWQ